MGALGAVLGASWAPLGALLGRLGRLLGRLGALAGRLGALGGSSGRLGRCDDRKDEHAKNERFPKGMGRLLPLGALCAVLSEPSRGVLGASWAVRRLLGRPEAILARLGLPWNFFWRLRGDLGKLWGGSGEDPRRPLGPLGALLGRSWTVLGASAASLGPSWAILRHSWRPLGRSWGDRGGLLGCFGRCQDKQNEYAKSVSCSKRNGTIFAAPGPSCGSSWSCLGGLLGCPEASLGRPGAILARLGRP